jgi:hypothetical protein
MILKKIMKKIMIIISILCLCAYPLNNELILGQMTPPNSTIDPNLKEYENTPMFLKLKIPETWEYREISKVWISLTHSSDKASISIEMKASKFNDSKKEISDYVRILDDEIIIKYLDPITISNSSSDVITKEYEKEYDADFENDREMNVMTVINGFTYDMEYSSDKKNFGKYLPEVKSILESLTISVPPNFKYNGMLLYEDPENRFSLQYPFDWDVKEKQNRFEDIDVRFINRTVDEIVPCTGGLAKGLFCTSYDTYEEVSLSIGNGPISSNISDIVDSTISQAESIVMTQGGKYFDLEEPAKYDYSIDGYPAGSFIYSYEDRGNKLVSLLVASLINGKLITISFTSTPELFDASLPLINNMIDSVTVNGS